METISLQQRIHILPEHIANQIAAGEVVQRPESVVKEIVENAIDAGATHVTVIVRNAGKTLIHILDNGRGMSREDLSLALKRHATSKIRTADDLHAILTLGFRGEALASIASVANVEIRTREAHTEHGWKLSSEPLREEHIEPVQQEHGTQIFIRNLFYNIPARKKFLRSDITEFRHISDTMMRFALSYPQLRFTFHDGDSLIFDLQPSSLHGRIESLFGRDVAMAAMPVEFEKGEVRISGYVCKPLVARTTKATQYFFLNSRYFTNKSLSHAVYQGYEHLIDKTQHPLYVLNISVNPQNVDVNIHPQKTEIKFDDERMMYTCVQESVMQTLRSNNLVPDVRFGLHSAQSPFEKVEYGFSPAAGNDMLLVNKLTGEIIEQRSQPPPQSHNVQSQQFNQRLQGSGSGGTMQHFDKTSAWNPSQMTAFDSLFSSPNNNDTPSQPQ
ncbi:MAG: DNA mismatch repair endonuclease MutL, partial [Candidatus Kapabacteria bacterium]|nr:DNA mismatch repair endonuclease MutL [Candidatus Kapabacteria bacterium]